MGINLARRGSVAASRRRSNITVPGAPTIGTATAGAGSASVTFTAPGSNGGAAIDVYRVTSSLGPTATGASSPITISGLATSAQTFTVAAHNSVGYGAASAASNSVTPTGGTIIDNIFTSQVPTINNDEGVGISYGTRFVSSVNGQVTGIRFYRNATISPATVIGALYSETGTLLGQATFGALSAGWNTVNLASAINITANTSYRATYWTSGAYAYSSGIFSSPIVNDKLTADQGFYTYSSGLAFPTTSANNENYFADVIFAYPGVATIPTAPTGIIVVGGNGSVSVTFTLGSNGGSTITGSTISEFTPNAGAHTGAVSGVGTSGTVSGLTNGTAYTFKVHSTNAVGTGPDSVASVSVTPSASVPFMSGVGSGDTTPSGLADFAAWRGSPVLVCSTWDDVDVNAQTSVYDLSSGGKFANFQGDLNLAMGGIFKDTGESWSAGASGAYDSRFTNVLNTMAGYWGARPHTLHIRFAHEFNLNGGGGYPWIVVPGEEANFIATFRRLYAIKVARMPSAKLCWSPAADTTSGIDVRNTFPGTAYCDEMSVDLYNQWPWVSTQAGFDSDILRYLSGGAPRGAQRWLEYAASVGLPLSFAEWANNGDPADPGGGGEAPIWITAWHTWLAANGNGSGQPGKVWYANLFNNFTQFELHPVTMQPVTAAQYAVTF